MEFERNVLVSPPMEVPRQHRADRVPPAICAGVVAKRVESV
jgi:hypothetical protein